MVQAPGSKRALGTGHASLESASMRQICCSSSSQVACWARLAPLCQLCSSQAGLRNPVQMFVCCVACGFSRNAFFNGLLQLLIKRALASFMNYLLTLYIRYKPITDVSGVLLMLISSSAAIVIDGFKQSADLLGPATID